MSKPFTAYWNMPGYLPDVEPVDFDTKEDALAYLENEISLWWDDPYTSGDEIAEAILHLGENDWVLFKGYLYGIGE